ncbi:hypothetical protein [Puia sp.]|jgi:hypothetical protein|uniref:hypothetical protein n=1 Tax=Puia sp. TaxID=2045100 RepID=UPI002F42D875
MKKTLFFLFSVLCLGASAQVDTTKVRQQINAYGYEWNNAAFNGSLRIPRDTFKLKVADSGSVAYKSGELWKWNGYLWSQITGAGGGADSGFQVLIVNGLAGMPVTKFVDGSGNRFILVDTSAPNAGAILTRGEGQRKLDSAKTANDVTYKQIADSNKTVSSYASVGRLNKLGDSLTFLLVQKLDSNQSIHSWASIGRINKIADSLSNLFVRTIDSNKSIHSWASIGRINKIADSLGALIAAGGGSSVTVYDSTKVWNTGGVIYTSTLENNVQEATGLLDSNSYAYSGSVASSYFVRKVVATEGFGSPRLIYFETKDSFKTHSSPIVLMTGYFRSSIHRKGDSLIMIAVKVSNGSVDRFASTALGAPSFTLTNAAILSFGSTGTWNGLGYANSYVFYDPDSTSSKPYRMIIDGVSAVKAYSDGIFASADDVNYSPYTDSNCTYLTGVWVGKVGPVFHMIGHRAPLTNDPSSVNYVLPTDIYHEWSLDFKHWYIDMIQPILGKATFDEGVDSSNGQRADPSIIVQGNRVELIYDAFRDGSSQGPTPPFNNLGGQIKMKYANMSLANLFQTTQNAVSGLPWQVAANRNTNPVTGTGFDLFITGLGDGLTGYGIGARPDTSALVTLGPSSNLRGGIEMKQGKAWPRNPFPGTLNWDGDSILYTYRTSPNNVFRKTVRLEDRQHVNTRFDSLTLESVLAIKGIFIGNKQTHADTLYQNGFPFVFNNNLHTQNLFLDSLNSAPVLQIASRGVIAMTDNANTPNLTFGGTHWNMQSIGLSQFALGAARFDNVNWLANGSSGVQIQLASGNFLVSPWTTSVANSPITFVPQFLVSSGGNTTIGAGSDPGLGKFNVISSSKQIFFGPSATVNGSLEMDAGHNVIISTGTTAGTFKMHPGLMPPMALARDSVIVSNTGTAGGPTSYGKFAFAKMARLDSAGTFGDKMTFFAPTTSKPSANFPAGTFPTSPSVGDFGFDGTHLYFHTSGGNTDLLLGGGGGGSLPSGQVGYGTGSGITSSSNFIYDGTQLFIAGVATNNSPLRAGNWEFSTPALNNMAFGDNFHWNNGASAYQATQTGYVSGIQMFHGNVGIFNGGTSTVSAGGSVTFNTPIVASVDDSVYLGGNITSLSAGTGARMIVRADGDVRIPTMSPTLLDSTNYKILVRNAANGNLRWSNWPMFGASGGYSTIQDNGSSVSVQSKINFVGGKGLVNNNSGNSSTDVRISGVIWSQTANGTAITNTTSFTTLLGTGVGNGSFNGDGRVGATAVWHGFVLISTLGTPQTIEISTAAGHTFTLPAGLSNQLCELSTYVVQTTNSGGTVAGTETMVLTIPGQTTIMHTGSYAGGGTDLVDSYPLVQWTTASTSNSIQSVLPFTLKFE